MLLAIILSVAGALFGQAVSVHALSSDSKMFISADNTFYAYVKGGEKISAAFARVNYDEPFNTVRGDVTVTLEGPDFKQQTCVMPKDIPFGQGCQFAAQTATKRPCVPGGFVGRSLGEELVYVERYCQRQRW